MPRNIYLLSLFLLIAFSMTINCDDEEPLANNYKYYSPEEAGPYYVGLIDTQWYNTDNDRNGDLAIWYPSSIKPEEGVEYTTDGAAEKSDAPYPILMFSHGLQGINKQSLFLMYHLASHGYIVVAPNHPDSTLFDYDSERTGLSAISRPDEISFCLDLAIEMSNDPSSILYGMVNENKAGIFGHSFGAYTTIALSGATISIENGFEFCQENPTRRFCEIVNQLVDMTFESNILSFEEERFLAAMPMAPGGYALFTDEGIAGIEIPTLVMGAGQDATTPYDEEAVPIYEALNVPKYLLEFEPAHHNVFSDFCGILGTPVDYCSDAFYGINVIASSFFGLYLKGLDEYKEFLTPSYAEELNQVNLTTTEN